MFIFLSQSASMCSLYTFLIFTIYLQTTHFLQLFEFRRDVIRCKISPLVKYESITNEDDCLLM